MVFRGWLLVALAATVARADLYPPLEPVWQLEVEGGCYMTPTVDRDWLYVGGLDRRVYALDRLTGTIRWQFETGGMVYGGIAVADGRAFAAADNQVLYCLDAVRGTPNWEKPLDGVLYASPVTDGTMVYVGTGGSGTVYGLDADDGAERWTLTMDDRMGSGMVLADGKLYIPSYDGRLHVVNAFDGQVEWTFDAGGTIDSMPLVAGGQVYLKLPNDTVIALDATGGERWRAVPQRQVAVGQGPSNWSPLVLAGELLLYGSLDGSVHALKVADGQEAWVSPGGTPRPCPPTPAGTLGWVGGKDGSLVAVDLATGEIVDRRLPGGPVDPTQLLSGMMWPPAIVGDMLYVSSINGGVYALRGEPDGTVWRAMRERTRGLTQTLAPATEGGPTPTPDEMAALADLSARVQGFVVWESRRSGGWEVYRMNLDGSGFRQLTNLSRPNDPLGYRGYLKPMVSPDGRTVAFAYGRRGGPTEIWTVPADGGEATKLAEGLPLRWQADGLALLFGRDRRIWKLDLAGGAEEPVSEVETPAFDVGMVGDLQPDLAAVVLRTPRANEYFRFDTQRTEKQLSGCEPQFTGDGKYVYWVQGPRDFRIWEVGTENEQQLMAQPPTERWNYTYFPTITPDGRFLAYGASPGEHSHDTGDYEVYLVELNGFKATGQPVRLTWSPATDRWPHVWMAP